MGEVAKDKDKYPVIKNKVKHYRCPYCVNSFVKLPPHMLKKHKDEEDIKKISNLKANDPERLTVLIKLRLEGRYLNNSTTNTAIQVARQPVAHKSYTANDYSNCPSCKETVLKHRLAEHAKTCLSIPRVKGAINLQQMSKLMMTAFLPETSKEAKQCISHLEDGEVKQIIINDMLLTSYANLKCEKYSYVSPKDQLNVRNDLRLMARLFKVARDIDDSLSDLGSLFDPKNWETYKEATKIMGKIDDEGNYGSPNNIPRIGTLTIEFTLLLIDDCIIREHKCTATDEAALWRERQKNCQDFRSIHKNRFTSTLAKKAYVTVAENERKKVEILPTKEEIKSFLTFLTKSRDEALATLLKTGFSASLWDQLLESTILYLMVFNRKRPGDIGSFKLSYYNLRQDIRKSLPDSFANLDKAAASLASYYKHIYIKGKKNRTVSLLLDPSSEKAVDYIIEYRKERGVPEKNPYLFGLPSVIGSRIEEYRMPRVYLLMCKYKKKSGIAVDKNITATLLRKQVATVCNELNLPPAVREALANFMGHNINIHNKFYRQDDVLTAVTKVSGLLENAIDSIAEGECRNLYKSLIS